MTVYTGPVFNWRASGLDWDAPPYESSSPNLLQLARYLRGTFGGGSMGIHYDKQTTRGVVSEHSWGAADDWGTGQAQVDWITSVGKPAGKVLTLAEHKAAVDWIVAHSAELHVQSIVDIGRSWRSDRTDNGAGGWIDYASGYTGHCHIVTTFDGWADDTPIVDRLKTARRADLFDISKWNDVTDWAAVPLVPIVHRTSINAEPDPRWPERARQISIRTPIFGGYTVLFAETEGHTIAEQMGAHVDAIGPVWRDGAFTQLDIEPWPSRGHDRPINADELDEAIRLHDLRFGPGRLCVYMNPYQMPDLWAEFKRRHPAIPTWVPGYRADDDVKAERYGATIHQWTDSYQAPGFAAPICADEVRDWAALERIANVNQPTPEPPPEDDMQTAIIWSHKGYANAFLVGAGPAINLSPAAFAHYDRLGVPKILGDDHPDMLKGVLHQAGLAAATPATPAKPGDLDPVA